VGSTRQPVHNGNGIKLVPAWGFVGIPLVWGIVQTLATPSRRFSRRSSATIGLFRRTGRAIGQSLMRWLSHRPGMLGGAAKTSDV
jgi:hypothetical protein